MKRSYGPPHPASVLLVSEPLLAGPSALYAQCLMDGLSSYRISHPLLTPASPGLGLLSKEELRFVQAAEGLDWLSWRPFVFRKILAWAREHEPELIHGISEHTAPLCAKLAEALKLPYVLTVHQFLADNALPLTARCRAVIAVSESLREHLVNDANISKERVRVIAPGVYDPGPLPQGPDFGNTAAIALDDTTVDIERLADAPPTHLVVSIGDFNQTSDYATFMEAIRHIADKEKDACSIVISGEGPQESSLRKFVRELKLDKIVTFCHGHTEHERLLAEADVYVQTTRREGFAVRALQAMALGIPVVAAANGAVLDLIKDGITGYVVAPANHAQLAERVLALLGDTALREKIGAAARAAVEEGFGAEKMTDATIELYREIAPAG